MIKGLEFTNGGKVREHGVYVSPHLMRNRCLKPRFLSRRLGEPRPDGRNVQKSKILAQHAAAESQRLNNEVIEEVVGRFREVSRKSRRNCSRILDDIGYRRENARGD